MSRSIIARLSGAVPVVVHDQDAAMETGVGVLAASPRQACVPSDAPRRRGRRTTNSLPRLPGPSLLGLDPAAVHLDQPLHQRQADAQPALRPAPATVDLREHLEDAGQHARRRCRCRCPAPDTATSPPCRSAVSQMRPPRSVYLAALFSRFEKTCASRVGSASTVTGSGGSVTVELVARLLDERAARLDRAGDDRRQFDRLLPQVRSCPG